MRIFRPMAQTITASLCLLPNLTVSAATLETIWGLAANQTQLQAFSLAYDQHKARGLKLPLTAVGNNSNHRLQFLKGLVDPQNQTTHLRYGQYYQGIPVWGAQVIYHIPANPDSKTWVTGSLVSDLEQDIQQIEHKLSTNKILAIALNKRPKSTAAKPQITPIIYLPEEGNKAIAAYHIMYGGFTAGHQFALHEFIIDASNGTIINYWNGLTTKQVAATGPGGVQANNLSYRVGNYQFGKVMQGVNALGVMNVDFDGVTTCTIANPLFAVFNYKNIVPEYDQYGEPILILPTIPFKYNCGAPNFINQNDNGYAPINKGISPINDVTYFTQKIFDMYKTIYKIAYPIGSSKMSLPVRSFTHLGEYNNAFACDIACVKGSGFGNTQIMVYGNGSPSGEGASYPLTDIETVGHELSHLVTSNFAHLIYANQSGGINEAFSDMAGVALESYVNSINNPFKIWSGPAADAPEAWDMGLSTSAESPPKPVRYLNNPPLDGHSIGNAANYKPKMNVHYSSGVFNKAFYLLTTTPGWTVERAFQVMLDANMSYWTPSSNFNFASCGVIQAAVNRGYKYQDVISAFNQVGVNCLVGLNAMKGNVS